MNILTNPSLDENHKNTLKSHEIKLGNAFQLGTAKNKPEEKIDLTNDDFLEKLTPELSAKIKETITIAKNKAQKIIDDAESQVEQVKQNAHNQGIQQGIALGKQEGYQDGINQALNDFRTRVISADRLVNTILGAKSQIYHAFEEELLDFVILIAQKLAHTELSINPQAIKRLIEEASKELKEKENIKILIHPQFAEKIYTISDDIKNTIYGLKNLKIVEDKTLNPEDIIIESSDSRVDASLNMQVEKLLHNLKAEQKQTPILDDNFLEEQIAKENIANA